MPKWLKVLIFIVIFTVITLFFGSVGFSLLKYISKFFEMIANWFAIAFGWLANLVNIFGFGVF